MAEEKHIQVTESTETGIVDGTVEEMPDEEPSPQFSRPNSAAESDSSVASWAYENSLKANRKDDMQQPSTSGLAIKKSRKVDQKRAEHDTQTAEIEAENPYEEKRDAEDKKQEELGTHKPEEKTQAAQKIVVRNPVARGIEERGKRPFIFLRNQEEVDKLSVEARRRLRKKASHLKLAGGKKKESKEESIRSRKKAITVLQNEEYRHDKRGEDGRFIVAAEKSEEQKERLKENERESKRNHYYNNREKILAARKAKRAREAASEQKKKGREDE